jgi:hypothetical protein
LTNEEREANNIRNANVYTSLFGDVEGAEFFQTWIVLMTLAALCTFTNKRVASSLLTLALALLSKCK